MRRQRIGILGGTFNPIHFGHLQSAEKAGDILQLDRVIFIPSGIPPHKDTSNLVDGIDRYRMVALAVMDRDTFCVSPMEIDRPGYSYTHDTLLRLRMKLGKKVDLFFLLGSDMVSGLPEWQGYPEILSLASFHLMPRYNGISSTIIRRDRRQGKAVYSYVPFKVGEYIMKKGLYS